MNTNSDDVIEMYFLNFHILTTWSEGAPQNSNVFIILGPDYMEAGFPSRQAGSFAEIRIRLILYAKNSLGKRAHKPECAYVIPAWYVTQKKFGRNSFVY